MPQLSTFHSQLSAFPAALPYHPALALWLSVDPLSDKYPGSSPYVYCGNNPVRLVDKDGREMADFFDMNGRYLGTDGIDDGKIYIVSQQDWNQFNNIENGKGILSDYAVRPSSANLSDDAIINIFENYNTTGITCAIQERKSAFLSSCIAKSRGEVTVEVRATVSNWRNSRFLDNYYDIKTFFDNESGHIAQYEEIGWEAFSAIYNLGEQGRARCEQYAIAWQVLNRYDNFARATEECRQHIINYLNKCNEKGKIAPAEK